MNKLNRIREKLITRLMQHNEKLNTLRRSLFDPNNAENNRNTANEMEKLTERIKELNDIIKIVDSELFG